MEEKKASYGYEKGIVVLIPKHKIMFINYGNNKEKFNALNNFREHTMVSPRQMA